jgi:hypothetical protein
VTIHLPRAQKPRMDVMEGQIRESEGFRFHFYFCNLNVMRPIMPSVHPLNSATPDSLIGAEPPRPVGHLQCFIESFANL